MRQRVMSLVWLEVAVLATAVCEPQEAAELGVAGPVVAPADEASW